MPTGLSLIAPCRNRLLGTFSLIGVGFPRIHKRWLPSNNCSPQPLLQSCDTETQDGVSVTESRTERAFTREMPMPKDIRGGVVNPTRRLFQISFVPKKIQAAN